MPTQCPVCGASLRIARLACDACDTAIEGSFDTGRLGRLTRDQIAFVEAFLECRGKIKDMEHRLGLSYPTVVARLEQVVSALGSPVVDHGSPPNVDEVLEALAKKQISPAEAARQIKARRGT